MGFPRHWFGKDRRCVKEKYTNEVFEMNAIRNKNGSMFAIFMAFMLVSAVFLGLVLIPGIDAAQGDFDDPYPDDTLLEGVGIGTNWAYDTSDQIIPINYTLREKAITLYPVQVMVYTIVDTAEVVLYKWIPADGDLADPFNWTVNLTIPADYVITVEVIFYEQIDTDYRMDSMDIDFTVLDGTGMVDDVMSDKGYVLNDGTDSIDIYFNVHRTPSEISDIQFNIYNEWLILAGGDGYVFSPNLTAADLSITPVGDYCNVSYTWDVPMAQLAGYISAPYDVVVEVTDSWGYNEKVYQDDLFEVVWMELPPYMFDGEIEFAEDSFAVVDL
ncbi:MAG: hypothetical protein JW939_10060, partial [Candidatus Thermoplasmatota archaeon]|nr:hypothetical protein [Candidatus Thermoplasmatota archaeon]